MAQERRPVPDARQQPHRRETALLGAVRVPTVPSLALPTGGGAHRGIGEKFQVSPVTGTASVNVPIPLSPGRPGGTPELQLAYDSGHGNGVFGLGWSLGLPSITRRTDKRLPRYTDARIDGVEPDTYVLAGAEDLVPALISDGAGGPRLDERDGTDDGTTFRVRRYRPRIDGAFARIERWTAADRTTHWRVTDRENRTTVFGRTDVSRIADPSDPTRVFEWLPDRVVNDRGEVISYVYVRENTLGVDPADPAERHRLAGPAPANRLLKRIRYAHERPGVDDSWQLELVLDYGDHDLRDPHSEPDRSWSVRPDPFSSYRAGFEVRTWRRCARLLMFHRFADLGGTRLVRSLDLEYDPVDPARGSLLAAATTVGWAPDPIGTSGAPVLVPGPTVRFDYRRPEIDPDVQTLDPDSARNLPVGLTGPYTVVDLDGEGLAGVLAETAGTWYYKPNLGGGRFGAATAVAPRPEPVRLGSPVRQQLLDLDGDGRAQLAEFRPELPGFFARTDDGGWERFVPFDALPTLDWADEDLRFVDLDGDGRADVLLAEDQGFTWYASAGRAGFAGRQRVGVPSDDEAGPPRTLQPAGAALQLADMSGDGLPDLVRVRADEVCYWPNLGHGRFGRKVTMARAPALDRTDLFDPRRVRLADVDGSGTSDLLYLRGDGIRLWINESGNGFGPEVGLPPLPHLSDLDDVRVLDLLGSGTGCLVWSTPLPDEHGRALRYVELLPKGKPYLLTAMSNSLGARTTFDYTPSTAFYRADADAGEPWVTRLPFPVQCLSRVDVRDEASGTRMVSEYRYHHGYYDRAEREFRGFAYVEQTDAEALDPGPGHDLDLPPVLIRRWFHTGPDPARGDLVPRLRERWYRGDRDALELPPPGMPATADPVTAREAARALRGQPLRTEVYADSPSGQPGTPYLVTDHRCAVTLLQERRADLGAGYAVFHTDEVDRVEHHYERQPADPRVTHHLVLDTDEFGAVTAAADIAYPRRRGAPDRVPEQDSPAVVATRRMLANSTDGPAHRLGVLVDATTYELTGLPVGPGVPPPRDTLLAALDTAAVRDYLEPPAAGRVQRRAVEQVRVLYTDGAGPLPLGEIGAHALPYESYLLAFTPDVLGEVYGADLDPAVLGADGGYVGSESEQAAGRFPATDDPGWWWLPSGRPTYDPDRFFLPVGQDDPFGGHTAVEYEHALVATAVTDPVGNRMHAAIDYRALRPATVTDPNGQTSAAAYDALGRLVGTAQPGDSLAGFVADLPPEVIARHLRAPTDNPGEVLGSATTRVLYDLTAIPAVTATLTRERRGDPAARVQPALTYTSGLGQELMRKLRAEPGPAPSRDADGILRVDRPADADPRWVGTGRVIRNNKGLPVRQYEPFFSDSPGYETEPQLVETGVTAVLRYDPLGRLVRADHPDGTVDSVGFSAWHTSTADRNDNVEGSQWLADRLDPGGLLAGDAGERAAASATLAAHAGTPTVSHLDPLGRVVHTVADNGGGRRFTTVVERDVEDNERAVIDARGITALRSTFDLLGNPIRQVSPDAGVRRALPDVVGRPLLAWTPRGAVLRRRYDAARRPVALVVTEGGVPRVRERTVYGDEPGLPFTEDERRSRGLRGRVYEVFDGAGVVTTAEYDPVGNQRVVRRRFVADPGELPDWDAAPSVSDEEFGTLTEHDVLHRVVREELPDGTVLQPGYNDAGLLDRIDLSSPGGRTERLVRNVDYDARGQRTRLEHGNGAVTDYRYDPLTFRLRRLLTTRGADALQDLAYTYDPVGNVTAIADAAQQAVFFRGTVAPASAGYTYDALYRLLSATGREHVGQAGAGGGDASAGLRPHYDHSDAPRRLLAHPHDGGAMRPYTQTFRYDEVGNLTRLHHAAGPDGTWTRVHEHAADSNRLLTSTLPGNRPPGRYGYDAAGNMVSMPHLQRLDWDYADRLDSVELRADRVVHYRYDSSGQRARKVVLDNGKIVEDRRYLGGYEVYRRLNGTGVTLERHTVHVLDGSRRAALVETTTVDARNPAGLGEPVIRYQLDNHLGSACLELDTDAAVLSYEEYYPYGATSYQAGPSVAEVSLKRYRFTGKERDEETGLGYHSARYYAPWLGRWISPDPLAQPLAAAIPGRVAAGGQRGRDPGERAEPRDTGRAADGATGDGQPPDPTPDERDEKGAARHRGTPYDYCENNPVKLVDHDGCQSDPASLVKDITANAENLLTFLKGHGHYALRGTVEAALAEAQGAQLSRGGADPNHFRNLLTGVYGSGGTGGLKAQLDQLVQRLNELKKIDPKVGAQLGEALKPLTSRARGFIDLVARTKDLIVELKLLHRFRLAGAPVSALGRDTASLVSEQLARVGAGPLVPPGLADKPWVQMLLRQIKELPITFADARSAVASISYQVQSRLSAALPAIRAAGGGVFQAVGPFLHSLRANVARNPVTLRLFLQALPGILIAIGAFLGG